MLKRKRPVNSCLPCRKRRLKCDKEHPSCGRCLSTNQECTYDETASTVTAQGSRRASTTIRPSHNGTEPNPLPIDLRKPSGSEDQGKLVYARGGRAFYNGATFWGNAILSDDMASTAEDVNGVGSLRPNTQFDDDSLSWTHGPFRPPPNSGLKIPSSAQSHCCLCGRGYRIACVQQMLPSADVCAKLCNVFFSTIFPLVPILHLQAFRQDLDELWAGFNERRACSEGNLAPIIRRKPGLLCLLSSILFSALHCTAPETLDRLLGQDRPKSLLTTTYLATMIAANLTGFPRRPSLYTLAAYIFIQGQFNREEEFHVAPEFISMAFRLSISMGLHRELHDANFSVPDQETRKRLWWYIVHLDVMASASSGLSPIFADDKMSNVGMIKEFDEQAKTVSPISKKRDIRYIIATKRYETTKEIRTILRLHFEDAYELSSCREETLARLERLAKNINRSCNSLLDLCASCSVLGVAATQQNLNNPDSSRVWSIEPGRNCEKDATNFAQWGVILLHMMIHKAYCTFYHPLFSQDLSGASDSGVRDNAVKHSQAFLHLFVRLCTDSTSKPYHWMYPGTYQPLQAVSLLIADLLHKPYSDEAETSRGLIDRMFEMYSVDHGIINKAEPARRDLSAVGRSAWRMLVRARRKALELMGEDSHLLIPSTPEGTTADKCVCGERIALSADYVPTQEISILEEEQEPSQTSGEEQFLQSAESSSGSEKTETQGQSTSVHSLWSDTDDFDWHEFEALAGISSGFMS